MENISIDWEKRLALATYLPRYNRSLARYAEALAPESSKE